MLKPVVGLDRVTIHTLTQRCPYLPTRPVTPDDTAMLFSNDFQLVAIVKDTMVPPVRVSYLSSAFVKSVAILYSVWEPTLSIYEPRIRIYTRPITGNKQVAPLTNTRADSRADCSLSPNTLRSGRDGSRKRGEVRGRGARFQL